MRLFSSILFLFILKIGFSQEAFDTANTAYTNFLQRITDKDTLIKNRTKYYKCSEDLSGRIEFYYQDKELILMTHIYKQGFGNNSFLENYFIERDTLRIKTSISEEMYMNTLYKESSQGVSSTSVEKVIEVTEQRMFFKNTNTKECFERKHGEKLAEWDQDYFSKLTFETSNCLEDVEDIRYKYRLLRKSEKKLQSYSNRKPSCIFHMW
ncbi:hypothetical protein [Aquimarina sp. 2201CG14-23]|uniref:hypothetical protein n=1 Tax=Aquimarina mycalae TaxID=3040073 RepID=UPI002477CBEB|nr:hypothetical protein [Aquimarina sp. 2201CG14-23]MDH7445501.1 hypothetical protein [Aquimarina sp. 2201CG14-23]